MTAAIVAFATAPGVDAGADAPPPYVMNRLPVQAMPQMVAGPMDRVRQGDVEGGQRRFEALLAQAAPAQGPASVEAADLLLAFGVQLYDAGADDPLGAEPNRYRLLSAEYLLRSVAAYRQAFGPRHPEVATALTSYADVLRRGRDEDPPLAAEHALEEALAIRRAGLGAGHIETLWTAIYYSDVQAAPARLREEPGRLDVAMRRLEQSLDDSRAGDSELHAEFRISVRGWMARLYGRGGRSLEARRVLRDAASEMLAAGTADCRWRLSILAEEAERGFLEGGQGSKAATLTAWAEGQSSCRLRD